MNTPEGLTQYKLPGAKIIGTEAEVLDMKWIWGSFQGLDKFLVIADSATLIVRPKELCHLFAFTFRSSKTSFAISSAFIERTMPALGIICKNVSIISFSEQPTFSAELIWTFT